MIPGNFPVNDSIPVHSRADPMWSLHPLDFPLRIQRTSHPNLNQAPNLGSAIQISSNRLSRRLERLTSPMQSERVLVNQRYSRRSSLNNRDSSNGTPAFNSRSGSGPAIRRRTDSFVFFSPTTNPSGEDVFDSPTQNEESSAPGLVLNRSPIHEHEPELSVLQRNSNVNANSVFQDELEDTES